jgi:tetratricopeptide (TPR) repeat protein
MSNHVADPIESPDEGFLERVEFLRDSGDWLSLVRETSACIENNLKFSSLFLERGLAYWELGEGALALRDFLHVLDSSPSNRYILPNIAQLSGELGDHKSAVHYWQLHLECDQLDNLPLGVSPAAWADYARECRLAGDTSRAIAVLKTYFDKHADRVTMRRENETEPMRLLAELLESREQYDQAAVFRRRAQASPYAVPVPKLTRFNPSPAALEPSFLFISEFLQNKICSADATMFTKGNSATWHMQAVPRAYHKIKHYGGAYMYKAGRFYSLIGRVISPIVGLIWMLA